MFIKKSLLAVGLSAAAAFTASLSWPVSALAQEVKPKAQTLFTNVNIFDGKSDKLAEGMSVLVEGNLIKKVAKGDIKADGAKVIDGGGRTLMPGLINSHAHLNITGGLGTSYGAMQSAKWTQIGAQAAANAYDQLLDGFTTVRDLGGMDNGLQLLIDKGILPGPRLYVSAAAIGPSSGHSDARDPASRTPGAPPTFLERMGIVEIADSPDEVRAASRRNFANGAHFLKLMAGGGVSSTLDPLYSHAYTQAELEAAVEAAEFFDTYVTVHVYTDRGVKSALDAGVKVMEHGNLVSEETVQHIKEESIFWVLNLSGLSPSLFSHPNFAPGTPSGKKVAIAHKGSKNLKAYVKKYKPKIVFAIDTVLSTMEQGRSNRDFEKWIHADWFGNHAMLVAATSTAGELAQLTGQRNPYPDGKLGVIEPGAYADILVVDGNPLEDLTGLGAHDKYLDAEPREAGIETIRVIMKDGKVYKNTL